MAVADERIAEAPPSIEALPWQQSVWDRVARSRERLPHALLLHGLPGLGKELFAYRLACYVLCQRPRDTDACGECRSCRLFAAGNHADFLCLKPEKEGGGILVDPVRRVSEHLSFTPQVSARKAVLISPAEAMNLSAANSLLKILEEPPAGSLLLLCASHPARVPATIRSRCTRVAFVPPAPQSVTDWLETRERGSAGLLIYASGAPLAALELARAGLAERYREFVLDLVALSSGRADPLACAARWKAAGSADGLEWLHRFAIDLLRAKTGVSALTGASHGPDHTKSFNLSIIELFGFIDMLSSTRRLVGSGVDEGLLLEEPLLRWCEITGSAV